MVWKVACVASVSNRVIACSCLSFLDEPREETLATQAIWKVAAKFKNYGNVAEQLVKKPSCQ